MRFGGAILAASLAVLAIPIGGAAAQHALPPENGSPSLVVPDGEATPAEQPPLSRAEQLDQLFATLATADSTEAARAAEEKIVGLWMESGSDTVDLLMKWALQAIDEENYPLALDLLDRITTLKPNYVEGWNKRASVYYLTEDYSKSLADIRRVLALEPRHFAALSGLGAILADVGDNKRAIEVYKRALEIDPHLDNVKKALDEIESAGSKI
jgi:tetratricopeptide (TPR) repeat protein